MTSKRLLPPIKRSRSAPLCRRRPRMALWSTKERSQLGADLVLAPERYDPRREALVGVATAVPLGTLALTLRKTVNPTASSSTFELFLVLDTSDAYEGIIIGQKQPVPRSEIGSTKKLVPPRSVIVSRLRPYLRQVAFVDEALDDLRNNVQLVCSTEFFVLIPRDDRSLAFLVPFLLSQQVQEVLAVSQEGGHHPRLDESTLLGLPVPKAWIERRDEVSAEFERAIACFRESRAVVGRLVKCAQVTMRPTEI
jgi:hypothetical protein